MSKTNKDKYLKDFLLDKQDILLEKYENKPVHKKKKTKGRKKSNNKDLLSFLDNYDDILV